MIMQHQRPRNGGSQRLCSRRSQLQFYKAKVWDCHLVILRQYEDFDAKNIKTGSDNAKDSTCAQNVSASSSSSQLGSQVMRRGMWVMQLVRSPKVVYAGGATFGVGRYRPSMIILIPS